MKTLTTTAAIFTTLIVTSCSVGYCGRPLLRLIHCNSTRSCVPTDSCTNETSCDSSMRMDQPSEMNILLTTELVALRQQLNELTVALADKDKAIEDFEELVSEQRDELQEKIKMTSRETERADQAAAKLAQVREEAKSFAEESRVAMAKAQKQIQNLKKQNSGLKTRLKKATSDLQKANRALAQQKKNPDQNDRDRKEKAIESPPVISKEDEAASTEDATQEGGQDEPGGDRK